MSAICNGEVLKAIMRKLTHLTLDETIVCHQPPIEQFHLVLPHPQQAYHARHPESICESPPLSKKREVTNSELR